MENELSKIANALEQIARNMNRQFWLHTLIKIIITIISVLVVVQMLITGIDHHEIVQLISDSNQLLADEQNAIYGKIPSAQDAED